MTNVEMMQLGESIVPVLEKLDKVILDYLSKWLGGEN